MMLLPVGRMYIRMESAMSIIVDKISYVYEAGQGSILVTVKKSVPAGVGFLASR